MWTSGRFDRRDRLLVGPGAIRELRLRQAVALTQAAKPPTDINLQH